VLAGLDLAGMVVALDALVAQRDAARPHHPGRRPLPDDRQVNQPFLLEDVAAASPGYRAGQGVLVPVYPVGAGCFRPFRIAS